MTLFMNLRNVLVDQFSASNTTQHTQHATDIRLEDAQTFDALVTEDSSNEEGASAPMGPIRQGLDSLLRKARDVARAPETEAFIDTLNTFLASPDLQNFIESDALSTLASEPSAENIIALLNSTELKMLAESDDLTALRDAQMDLTDLVLGEEQPFNIRNIVRSDESKALLSEKYDFLTSDELSALFGSDEYAQYLEDPTPENLFTLLESSEFKALENSEEYAALRDAQMNFVDLILDGDVNGASNSIA